MTYRIIAVDDQPDNLLILEDYLGREYAVTTFGRGQQLIDYFTAGGEADLILLDVVMPMPDGYTLCRWLKGGPLTRDIPVMFLTSLESSTDEAFALSLGAEDFIHKPLSQAVVLGRVRNHLLLAQARKSLQDQNRTLERMVAERTRKIQEQSDELARRSSQIIAAQSATISAFCSLVEARDNETGNHILRTQHYMLALCEVMRLSPHHALELSDENITQIFKSAPLHDIGKVAIPDHILLKPGKLDPAEWEIMKRHAEFGAAAIAAAQGEIGNADTSFLEYARLIALTHHERWDGSGYPRALAGGDIPLAGRMMAVADVYDALISRRIYKPPYSHDEAIAMIVEERGKHFDPEIIDRMLTISGRFADIARRFADAGSDDKFEEKSA
ncbi:MAG: response regulator [Propionivibrio sp.]|jgi:putative two-component system response regulator|nr:response regulator [Propionivibrio sp.]